MATSRLLGLGISNKLLSNNGAVSSRPVTVIMCLNKVGLSGGGGGGGVTVKAAGSTPALVLERETEKGVDLLSHSHWRKFITKPRSWSWRFHIQMFIERAILDCRFFTLLAISGSLVGSFRCFVEGCFMIVVSYLHPLSQQGHVDVVLQIIEAIDMFLMGTAMLVFAMALHAMFVGPPHDHSNSSFINLKVETAMQAKSKMGHALIMILQIQVLDKCKSISVSSGMDLACFAAAIFLSSASIFLLSRTNSKPPPQTKP